LIDHLYTTFKNKTSPRYPILEFMTAKNINFGEQTYSKQNCMFAFYPTIVRTETNIYKFVF